MRLYLSGPMTGIVGLNYEAFAAAAKHLRACGLTVVSPHEVQHPNETAPGSLPWTDYLRGDLRALLDCNAIALLPGWPASKGARLELAIALQLDFQVFFYDPQHGALPMSVPPAAADVPL